MGERIQNGYSEQMKEKSVVWLADLLIGAAALVIVGAMDYNLYTSSRMAMVHEPFVDAALKIKLEATTAHLWLEKTISDDARENVERIRESIDKAERYVQAMLEGGEVPRGRVRAVDDQAIRREVFRIREKLDQFKSMTAERWKARSTSGTGSHVSQRYDAAFGELMERLDLVETMLQKSIARQLRTFRAVQITLIFACVGLTLIVGALLDRFIRRQVLDKSKVRAANQQLDAANQQLRANEQQLRAANQQLVADEQQLKAANQQLAASGQQLRALNQRLIASEAQSRSLARFPEENPSPVLRIAKDGMVIYGNKAGEELLEAWGAGIGKYLPENRSKFVTEVFNSASPRQTEFGYSDQTLSLTFVPVREADYVNIYGHDITDRKRVEQTLRLSEARYRELFGHMGSCVAVYEAVDDAADFVFRDFNTAAEKAENISKGKVLGRRVTEVFPRVREFGLFEVFQRVWKTGKAAHHPVMLYEDQRISGWKENYVYKLPSGEIVAISEDVTERKKADAALRESEQKLRSIVEHSNEMFYIHNTNHKFTYVSPYSQRITGYTPEEMMRKWTELPTDDPINETALELTEKALRTGTKQKSYPVEIRTKNGAVRLLEIDESPLKSDSGRVIGMVGAARDITERKLAEQSLRESEEKFRNLSDYSPNMIFINKKGRVVYANEKCEQIMEYTRKELYAPDFDFMRLIAPEYMDLVRENFAKHMKGKDIAPYEYALITRDGRRLDTILTTRLIKYEGETAILGTITDITDRKRAEEELKKARDELEKRVAERTAELAKANEQLRDEIEQREQIEQREREHQGQLAHYSRLSTISEMTSGLAHELNQPLCAIANYARGSLRIMKSGAWDSAELLDAMDGIGAQAERAGEIIRRMRELVRKRESHRTTIRIKEVVAEAVSLVEAEARLKGIKIRQVKPDQEIPVVFADPIHIEQILVNLLQNGFEAMTETPQDKRQITIEISTEQDGITVSVSDTGRGIPTEIIDRVFEPFFTTKSEGLGMGLSISRSIMEAHGGRIKVSGNSPAGTTFQFTLPAKGVTHDRI